MYKKISTTNKFILLNIIALLIISFFPTNKVYVNAETEIPVYLNNNRINFIGAKAQIINDRTMVPFREIGEALGASVSWYEPERKVTMYTKNSYVVLHIDTTVMVYGTYTSSSTGDTSPNTFLLDSPPVIVNGNTLVPLKAVSLGLGAEALWDDVRRSVNITYTPPAPEPSPTITPEPTIEPTPTPEPTPDPELFEDTNTFKNISGKKAQSMYDTDMQFILFYYDSTEELSQEYVNTVKDIAHKNRLLIYAVDEYYENNRDLSFIWDYASRNKDQAPLIFFVDGNYDVIVSSRFENERTLNFMFEDFIDLVEDRDNTWGNSRLRYFEDTDYFKNISAYKAQSMYDSDEQFILFYYNSKDDSSKEYVPTVKKVAQNNKQLVYAVDEYQNNNNKDLYFIWDYASKNYDKVPMLFFVDGTYDVTFSSYLETEKNLEYMFKDFIDVIENNSGKYIFDDTTYFRNITGFMAQSKYDNNDKFILYYYNSKNNASRNYVTNIKNIAQKNKYIVYAIDEASENNNSNLYFIWDYVSKNNHELPLLFFINNNYDVTLSNYLTNENNLNFQFQDFIQSVTLY